MTDLVDSAIRSRHCECVGDMYGINGFYLCSILGDIPQKPVIEAVSIVENQLYSFELRVSGGL